MNPKNHFGRNKNENPSLQERKSARRDSRTLLKCAGPFAGADIPSLLSGPENALLSRCAELIRERRITTRHEFARFAPSHIVRHFRKKPELWDKVGLVDPYAASRKKWKPMDKSPAQENFLSQKCSPPGKRGWKGGRPKKSAIQDPGTIDEIFPAVHPDEEAASAIAFLAERKIRKEGTGPLPLPARRNSTPPEEALPKWEGAGRKDKELLKNKAFKAAREGSGLELLRLLKKGVPISSKDHVRRTILEVLAERGNSKTLDAIREFVPDLGMRLPSGETLLMVAADAGHVQFMKYLLSGFGKSEGKRRESFLNARDSKKRTALMLAAWSGEEESVRFLLRAGAGKNLRDAQNNTAEKYARLEGHEGIVRMLSGK